MNYLPPFDSQKETNRIVGFIRNILNEQKHEKVVIGVSGGIDSMTSFYLLKKAIDVKHIYAVHLPYFEPSFVEFENLMNSLSVPLENTQRISIKSFVNSFQKVLGHLRGGQVDSSEVNNVRLGNSMARVRMIVLYDLAKKQNALVCGTENKSEYHLAYFTRFGDEASDLEPIRHLYKTHIYELAKYLQVPQFIIDKPPTAGLWQGQTDEKEFGFSYKEADQVLYLHFDKKETAETIEQKGFKNARKIISWCKKNSYKHHVPFML